MITITWLDALIIFVFLVSVVVVGSWAARRAGQDAESFFLSGRNMPWWLLGVSMVECVVSRCGAGRRRFPRAADAVGEE